MAAIKHIHLLFVALSFLSFFIRGIWMMKGSPLLRVKVVRIAPHVIDTALIVSAVTLAVMMSFSPMQQPWLLTKIIALFVYIGIGVVAFKSSKPMGVKVGLWGLALVVYLFIISVAMTKSPLGFLVALVN